MISHYLWTFCSLMLCPEIKNGNHVVFSRQPSIRFKAVKENPRSMSFEPWLSNTFILYIWSTFTWKLILDLSTGAPAVRENVIVLSLGFPLAICVVHSCLGVLTRSNRKVNRESKPRNTRSLSRLERDSLGISPRCIHVFSFSSLPSHKYEGKGLEMKREDSCI